VLTPLCLSFQLSFSLSFLFLFLFEISRNLGWPRLLGNSVGFEGLDPCMHPHAIKTSPAGKLAMGRGHPKRICTALSSLTHAGSLSLQTLVGFLAHLPGRKPNKGRELCAHSLRFRIVGRPAHHNLSHCYCPHLCSRGCPHFYRVDATATKTAARQQTQSSRFLLI
jgi:hypothetical protein